MLGENRYDVFLSYAHKDIEDHPERERYLVELKRGIERLAGKPLVFLDSESILPGETWNSKIMMGIHSCKVFLCLLSKNYLESEYCKREYLWWCQKELQRGRIRKMTLPVYYVRFPEDLEDVASSSRLADELLSFQFGSEARPWFGEGEDCFKEELVRERLEEVVARTNSFLDADKNVGLSFCSIRLYNRAFVGRLAELRKLWDLCRTERYYVRISDATVLAKAEAGVAFVPFGMVKSLYTRELVLNSHVDKLAKLVHATWSGIDWQGQPTAKDWQRIDQCWARADLYSRQSSRASALGAMNMLSLLGYESLATDEDIAKDDVVCSINEEWASRNMVPRSVVEVLARNEHLRWCQYMLWSGFKTWNLREPVSLHDDEVREWIKKNKSGKLPGRKLHAALIGYDRLPWLDSEMANALGQRTVCNEDPCAGYFEGKDEVSLLSPGGEVIHDTTMQGKDIRNVRDIYEKAVIAGMNEVKLKRRSKNSVGMLRDMARMVYENDKASVVEGAAPDAGFMKLVKPVGKLRSDVDLFRLGRYEYAYIPRAGMILPRFYIGDLLAKSRRFIDWKQPRFVAQVQRIGDTVYVSFGGTACWRDWFENFKQLFGHVPSQFELSAELLRIVAESTKSRICVVGHSEGGGEVQYSLLKNVDLLRGRVNGFTFNAQRLSNGVLNQFTRDTVDQVEKVIVNYRIPWDVVSGWKRLGRLLGPVFDFHGDWRPVNMLGFLTSYCAHKMSSFKKVMSEREA